ncbi:uncharacterized protein LOC134822503 [Bolinopsis microptera]|uniref:uncharacterized protein LOC134822503 n=1 Tax=Bolinopsis microptera TaxID=2820187 RepID=UPI0030799431
MRELEVDQSAQTTSIRVHCSCNQVVQKFMFTSGLNKFKGLMGIEHQDSSSTFKRNQSKKSDEFKQWELDHQKGVVGCLRVNDNYCVEHWCRNLGARLRNHKFPFVNVLVEKKKKDKIEVTEQKNASIRGAGGHPMTGEKCTSLQIQVKKVVKSVTAETISVEAKMKRLNKGIRGVFLHNCMVTPPAHRHKLCPKGKNSFCGWRRQQAGDLSEYDEKKKTHLYGEFYQLLLPIIDEFTSDLMLVKLSKGLHTDDLESLFSSVHSQHSKKKFRGPEILRGAFARGVVQNNSGHSYLRKIVEKNSFKPTLFLTKFIVEEDKKRIVSEETYMDKEMIDIVKTATGAAAAVDDSYKSGQFD